MGFRTLNAYKSGLSFVKSVITGIPEIKGMPVAVSTELTNHCNLSCAECPSGQQMLSRERGFLDRDLFDKILSELEPYLFYLTLHFQGESMMHPHFFDFLERSRYLNTILSTNGHFLKEENTISIVKSGLRKIIISVDGMDQETYSSYRINGDLATVINGLENLREARKRMGSSLKVEIQFLVNKRNEHQISAAKHLARQMDASLKLKSMQIIDPAGFEKWLPTKNKYSRYRKGRGTYKIKSNLPNRCTRLWFNPVVTWDGKVIPCCFDKNACYVMGDLNKETFRDIWFGEKYRSFRKKVFTERRNIDICRNCTSGLRRTAY